MMTGLDIRDAEREAAAAAALALAAQSPDGVPMAPVPPRSALWQLIQVRPLRWFVRIPSPIDPLSL